MKFAKLFAGNMWPTTLEWIGVMSIDSLDRQWEPVVAESGFLIARSKDGNAALIGRMSVRDDGKLCVELVVKAVIHDGKLCDYEFWCVNFSDGQRHVHWLEEVLGGRLLR